MLTPTPPHTTASTTSKYYSRIVFFVFCVIFTRSTHHEAFNRRMGTHYPLMGGVLRSLNSMIFRLVIFVSVPRTYQRAVPYRPAHRRKALTLSILMPYRTCTEIGHSSGGEPRKAQHILPGTLSPRYLRTRFFAHIWKWHCECNFDWRSENMTDWIWLQIEKHDWSSSLMSP